MPLFRRTLTKRIALAAERGVESILDALSERPDISELHGVALCTVSDATSVYWTAETKSQRDDRINSIVRRVRTADPACTLSFDDVLPMYRYEPADWPITDSSDGLPLLTELNGAIDEYWTQLESSPVLNLMISAPTAIKRVLSAVADGMMHAMSRSDRNAIDWSETFALVWINDPDDPGLVRQFARRLNCDSLYEGFSEHYFNSH